MSEQGGIEDNVPRNDLTTKATRAYKAHYPRMLMANHFSSRAPYIHSLPQFCNNSACRLVC